MSDVLADTQAVVWFLFDPSRLSPEAILISTQPR